MHTMRILSVVALAVALMPLVGPSALCQEPDIRPELQNRSEVAKLLERHYPAELKRAGVEGRTLLWVFIGENGRVQKTLVHESSGYPALDTAAVDVAAEMRFSPAYHLGNATPVWIAVPIEFRKRNRS